VANCSTFVFADVTAEAAASAGDGQGAERSAAATCAFHGVGQGRFELAVCGAHDRRRSPQQIGAFRELRQDHDELLAELLRRQSECPETRLELLQGRGDVAARVTEELGQLGGRFARNPRHVLHRLLRHSAHRTGRLGCELLDLLLGQLVSLHRLTRRDVDVPDGPIADLAQRRFGAGADTLDDRGEVLQYLGAHRFELLGDPARQDANRLDRARIRLAQVSFRALLGVHDSNRAPLDGARRFRIRVAQSTGVVLGARERAGRGLGEDDAPGQPDERRDEAQTEEPQHLSAVRSLR
jgi:hypothetical protein